MTRTTGFGGSSRASLSAVMDELNAHRLAPIGNDVATLVGAARGTGVAPEQVERELVEAGLSFLVGLIEPLRHCVRRVTGDAASLTGKSADWTAVAAQLRAALPQIQQTTATARATWTGTAAEAFNTTMGEFSETVTGAAAAAAGVATLLATSSELMTGARTLVVDIVGRVSEYMVAAEAAAAASAVQTMGASGDAALAAIIGEVSQGVEDAIAIVDRVSVLLQRIATTLDDIAGVFDQVTTLLAVATHNAQPPPPVAPSGTSTTTAHLTGEGGDGAESPDQ